MKPFVIDIHSCFMPLVTTSVKMSTEIPKIHVDVCRYVYRYFSDKYL